MEHEVLNNHEVISSFALTLENAEEFVNLCTHYEDMHFQAFHEERMDLLKLQPDLVIGSSRCKTAFKATPIDSKMVKGFYTDCYKVPSPSNDTWRYKAVLLLKDCSVSFKDDANLSAPFTPEEIWASVVKSAKDKHCDPHGHGLPTEVLTLGGCPLASFIASILNGIHSSLDIDHEHPYLQGQKWQLEVQCCSLLTVLTPGW